MANASASGYKPARRSTSVPANEVEIVVIDARTANANPANPAASHRVLWFLIGALLSKGKERLVHPMCQGHSPVMRETSGCAPGHSADWLDVRLCTNGNA